VTLTAKAFEKHLNAYANDCWTLENGTTATTSSSRTVSWLAASKGREETNTNVSQRLSDETALVLETIQ